jgi:hypothetical protein
MNVFSLLPFPVCVLALVEVRHLHLTVEVFVQVRVPVGSELTIISWHEARKNVLIAKSDYIGI